MKTKKTHLTSHERQTIKNMIDKRESFKSIARGLGRDCTIRNLCDREDCMEKALPCYFS